MKRLKFEKWNLVLISAIALIILAVILLCNFFKTERIMIIYIGICLIFDGLVNLVSFICIQTRMRKLTKIQMDHPDMTMERIVDQYAANSRKNNNVDQEVIPYQNKGTEDRSSR